MSDKPQNITHQKLDSNMPSVIKISAFGMDERSLQRLKTMFTIIFKGRCQLVEPEEAMVALIDVNDDNVSENILQSCKKDYPTLPSIILVRGDSSDQSQDNVRYLDKPLKREDFWEALVSLFDRKELMKSIPQEKKEKASKSNTSASAAVLDGLLKNDSKGPKIAPLKEAGDNASILFEPKKYLLGYLQHLLSQQHPDNCALRLEFAYKYQIVLFPSLKMALTNLDDNQYRTVAIMPFHSKEICKLTVENNADFKQILAGKNEFSEITIDGLLWTLALRTSRGRVPKGTPVNKPLYLHKWPNLTRLCKTPHAMRIASLWIDNPRSLNDIAISLGIDHGDVYSFFSAANALGLAGSAKRKVDTLIEAKPVETNKKRGLFGAILRRLKRNPQDK